MYFTHLSVMILSGAYHSSNMYSALENFFLQNTGRTREKPVLVSINAFQLILFMSRGPATPP